MSERVSFERVVQMEKSLFFEFKYHAINSCELVTEEEKKGNKERKLFLCVFAF